MWQTDGQTDILRQHSPPCAQHCTVKTRQFSHQFTYVRHQLVQHLHTTVHNEHVNSLLTTSKQCKKLSDAAMLILCITKMQRWPNTMTKPAKLQYLIHTWIRKHCNIWHNYMYIYSTLRHPWYIMFTSCPTVAVVYICLFIAISQLTAKLTVRCQFKSLIDTFKLQSNRPSYSDWYAGRWWTGCYIWYSEEGTEQGRSPPGSSSLYQM